MEQPEATSKNSSISIIGHLTLQNEFLSYVITKEIGSVCSIYDKDLNTFSPEATPAAGEKQLILIDTEMQSFEEILKSITTNGIISQGLLALFNLNENAGVERKALARNIRGFFL